jgi:hypothetical protein
MQAPFKTVNKSEKRGMTELEVSVLEGEER